MPCISEDNQLCEASGVRRTSARCDWPDTVERVTPARINGKATGVGDRDGAVGLAKRDDIVAGAGSVFKRAADAVAAGAIAAQKDGRRMGGGSLGLRGGRWDG
jgi:hypothetical protein